MNASLNLGLTSARPEPAASAELANVTLGYSDTAVLRALSWQLLPGQVIGLLGRNGAGKTSLLEALLGLREAEQGRITLFGQPVAELDDACRARIGYVPQQSYLFPTWTATQLLAYFRSFYPRWNERGTRSCLLPGCEAHPMTSATSSRSVLMSAAGSWPMPRKTSAVLDGGEDRFKNRHLDEPGALRVVDHRLA